MLASPIKIWQGHFWNILIWASEIIVFTLIPFQREHCKSWGFCENRWWLQDDLLWKQPLWILQTLPKWRWKAAPGNCSTIYFNVRILLHNFWLMLQSTSTCNWSRLNTEFWLQYGKGPKIRWWCWNPDSNRMVWFDLQPRIAQAYIALLKHCTSIVFNKRCNFFNFPFYFIAVSNP